MNNLEIYIKRELDNLLSKCEFIEKVITVPAKCHPIIRIDYDLESVKKNPILINHYLTAFSYIVLSHVENSINPIIYTSSKSAVYGEILSSIKLKNGLNVFLVNYIVELPRNELYLTAVID